MLQLTITELEAIYQDVMDSGDLGKTGRKRKIFQYLWEHTIPFDAVNITQYSIAFDVLGRPKSFNPETDGIVRTEIGRLRRALKTYSARSDDYTIKIPKGRYELVISKKKKPFGFFKTRIYALIVFCFLALTIVAIGKNVTSVITMADNTLNKPACYDKLPILEVVHNSAETEITQFVLTTIEGVVSQNTHLTLMPDNCRSVGVPHYLLEVTTVQQGNQHSLLLSIRPLGERKNLTLTEFGVSFDQVNSYENLFFEIARTVNEIIKPYGSLARNSVQQEWGDLISKANYACLIKMYDYYETETDEDYLEVHNCLLESEKHQPVALDVQGALAASYLEQAKSYRASTEENPYLLAEEILSRNRDIINQSAELMIAKMTYEAERPNFASEQMSAIILTAESSFSANPLVLLNASGYTGLKLGDWERATRLSDRARRLMKERDQSVYAVDAFNTIISTDPNLISENCFRFYSENSIFANLVVKACANKFNHKYWGDKTDVSLTRLGLQSTEKQIAFLKERGWHASLIDPMTDLIAQQPP